MAALRLELEISTVEPSGDMVFVEGHGPGSVQLGLMLPASMLAARVGQRLAVSVEAAASPSTMRERMVRASSAATESAPPASAGSAPQNMTDVVLAAVFGTSPTAEIERDVNEEMDALFGRRR